MDGWQVPTSNGKGRGRRLVTWLILGWTAVMGTLTYLEYRQIETVHSADEGISLVIGMVVLFCMWLVGFIVLSVIWSRTRPDGPAA